MKSTLLNSRMFAMLGVAAALVLGCSATLAATWTGLGSDANWMTSGNWTPGVPAPGDSLIFDGTPSVSPFNNFPAVTPFGGITFPASAGPFTLEGDALELDGSLSNLSGSSQVINCPISLTNVVTFNIGAETTINVISNTGGLVKTGTGTLILNNKTFSGGMTVNSGLVQINNQSGGTVTMSGGSLMLNVRSWWWDNLTVPFTANAEVGIDLPIGSGGNPLGIDFAGSIGSPGFKWTKTGQGIIYVTHWSSDANPTIIVQASSIDIAQGTLANLPNGATDHAIARWGTNAINVAGGAALAATDGTIAFNPVTINGEGTGNNMGALYSARRNNGDATSSNAFLGPITLASDSGIGTFFGKLYLMGNISGPGGFTKLGSDDANSANLLVLGGTNTYNGSTFIATGTVQLASSAALPSGSGKGNLVLNGPSTLDLKGFSASVNGFSDDAAGLAKVENTSTNLVTLTLGGNDQAVSFSGAIKNSGGGALSIAKVGSGAATLLGANTFSGAVSVSGGTLDLNISPGTTTGYAPLIVSDGTELTLRCRIAGSSLKTTGATIGGAGATTLNFNVGAFGNPSAPMVNATSGTGVLAANGTITINISGDGSLMWNGQFPLIKYTSRTGNGNFVLGTLPTDVVGRIVTNTVAKSIDLLIDSAPVLTWVGNLNNVWDTTTANWSILGVGGKIYTDGKGVLFPDGAQRFTVDLGYLTPSATLISASNNYTFMGSGQLNGGDLTKSGSGKLTLLIPCTYNNTVIAGGTLQVDTNGFTGTLGGGNVINEGTLVMARADAYSIDTVVSGSGKVVQQGIGTLALNGINSYSGGTWIDAGTVQLGDNSALGSPAGSTPLAIVTNGATLNVGTRQPGSANPIVISGFGDPTAQSALMGSGYEFWEPEVYRGVKLVRLAGDASVGTDGGTFAIGNGGGGIDGRGFNLVKVGTDRLALMSSAVSAPAQVIVGAGGISIQSANPFGTGVLVTLTNGAYLDSWGNNGGGATYNIYNNIVIGAGGGSIRNAAGSWWGRFDYDNYFGTITLNDNLTVDHRHNNGGASGDGQLNFWGAINGPAGIIKTGPYLVSLAGANSYRGTATVNEGMLAISTISQGGGAYVVNDGAGLDVPPQLGFSTVPMSSLAIGSSTGAVLNLSRYSSLSTTVAPITATNLSISGPNLMVVAAGAFTSPGQYPLIKYAGAVTGGGSLSLGESVRGMPGYITNNTANSSIDLVVTAGSPVTWIGNVNDIWDIGSPNNFSYLGAATSYQQSGALGDAVTFNDAGLQTNVAIASQLSPALIVVSNANKSYTFMGTNILGAGQLLKTGPGSLTLSNGANAFTGGSSIKGGTVKLRNAGSLNSSGTVTISDGGTLDTGGMDIRNMTVNVSGAGVGGNGALVADYVKPGTGPNQNGPGTINLTGSATIGVSSTNEWDLRNGAKTLNCPTNAFSLTKVGSGTIKLANNAVISPNLGDIYILGGMLGFEAGAIYGDPTKTIYVGNGGALGLWQSTVPVNKPLVCSNGSAITVYGGNLASQNIVAAPILLTGGRFNINANYNNGILFSNVISGEGGVWVQWNSDVLFSAANTFKGDLDINGRVKLVANAVVSPTNNVTVNNGGSGVLTVQDNAVVNCNNLRVWNGPLGGTLILKNNGTLNFTNMFQVGNGGATALADWSAIAGSTLTIGSGKTFRMDAGGRVKGNLVMASGSTFSPGGGWWLQNGGVFTNDVTLQPGSTTWIDVSMDGGTTNNDAVVVLGNLSYGGTLQINLIGTNLLTAGTTFKLFTFSNSPGSFANFAANTPGQIVTWDTSQLGVNGTIRVASAIPAGTRLSANVLGNQLILSWPTENLGWSLQVQTNRLESGVSSNPADWATVPGSAATTSVTNLIDTAKRTEFYRLSYP